jgi:hypothetical protein
MDGKGHLESAALQPIELDGIITLSSVKGAYDSLGFGFRGEAHPPEVIQGLERLDANFPKAVRELLSDPDDAKSRRLLRESVGDQDLGAYLQGLGGPDHRPESSDHAGMSAFLESASALRNALDFHRNADDDALGPPAILGLKSFGQATRPF